MIHLRWFIKIKKLSPHLVLHKNESHLSGITPCGSIQYKVHIHSGKWTDPNAGIVHTHAHAHEIASKHPICMYHLELKKNWTPPRIEVPTKQRRTQHKVLGFRIRGIAWRAWHWRLQGICVKCLNSFLNFVKRNQIWIAITLFRLI